MSDAIHSHCEHGTFLRHDICMTCPPIPSDTDDPRNANQTCPKCRSHQVNRTEAGWPIFACGTVSLLDNDFVSAVGTCEIISTLRLQRDTAIRLGQDAVSALIATTDSLENSTIELRKLLEASNAT